MIQLGTVALGAILCSHLVQIGSPNWMFNWHV
jgi:hypothetical protein